MAPESSTLKDSVFHHLSSDEFGRRSNILGIASSDTTLFYLVEFSSTGIDNSYYELWSADIASGVKTLRKSFENTSVYGDNGVWNDYSGNLTVVDNNAYFTIPSHSTGAELWAVSGNDLTISPDFIDDWVSRSAGLVAHKDSLYYSKAGLYGTDQVYTQSLQRVVGSNFKTPVQVNVDLPSASSDSYGFSVSNIKSSDGLLYVGQDVERIWVLDEQANTLRIAVDVNGNYSNPSQDRIDEFISFNGTFLAGMNVSSLSGTTSPSVGLSDGELYYTPIGKELWIFSDGSYTFRDINPGYNSSSPREFTVVGEQIFFTAYDGSVNGLWVTDGTQEGTRKVTDTEATGLAEFNGKLLYASNASIWSIDGSASPLLLSAEGSYGDPGFAVVGDKAYFTAPGSNYDYELWVTDGTPEGTYQALDIIPYSTEYDPVSSHPSNLLSVGGELFFSAFRDDESSSSIYRYNDSYSYEPLTLYLTDGGVISADGDVIPPSGSVQEGEELLYLLSAHAPLDGISADTSYTFALGLDSWNDFSEDDVDFLGITVRGLHHDMALALSPDSTYTVHSFLNDAGEYELPDLEIHLPIRIDQQDENDDEYVGLKLVDVQGASSYFNKAALTQIVDATYLDGISLDLEFASDRHSLYGSLTSYGQILYDRIPEGSDLMYSIFANTPASPVDGSFPIQASTSYSFGLALGYIDESSATEDDVDLGNAQVRAVWYPSLDPDISDPESNQIQPVAYLRKLYAQDGIYTVSAFADPYSPNDYILPMQVDILLPVIADGVSEGDEHVNLRLADLQGATASSITPAVTIIDGDNDTTTVPAGEALALRYSLKNGDESNSLNSLDVLGVNSDPGARYMLEITAASLLDGYSLESADITLALDPVIFGDVAISDIRIGSSLPTVNSVSIDNTQGLIRIAASSLSDLAQGSGIVNEAVLASISLDFDEAALAAIEQNSDKSLVINPLEFGLSVNVDETVLSRSFSEASGLLNREIVSLADLGGGVAVQGQPIILYGDTNNPLIIEQQGDGMVLGTQRVIGVDAGFTNLVRENDVLEVTSQWRASRDLDGSPLAVLARPNQNAELVNAITSVAAGSNGQSSEIDVTASVKITGDAGSIVDLSDDLLALSIPGSQEFSNSGKGSKNLVTFQGDLNYDGRVSMKDLAYLNAGAARQTIDGSTNLATPESYARDVDADFNGKIDLADLAVLDADWGKSLHTGDQDFVGSADLSWTELDTQGTVSWDNTSFKTQNAVEAAAAYVGTLEPLSALAVIGDAADGDQFNIGTSGPDSQDPPLI